MNILEQSFEISINIVNNLNNHPSDDELFEIYAYYKQATIGNNITDEPSIFNFTAKKKWDAWTSVKDMNSNIAIQNYIHLVMNLYKKYS